jgi:hypothetical protein
MFEKIDYLKTGSETQRRAHMILRELQIMEILQEFDPLFVGSIPINVDVESSDLDVICCYQNKKQFEKIFISSYAQQEHFEIKERFIPDEAVIGSFVYKGVPVEIFGQSIPTRKQLGWRHMRIEHQLLQQRGEAFRQEIIALKQGGYRTEPAFAAALGLKGDPYTELLSFENKIDNA